MQSLTEIMLSKKIFLKKRPPPHLNDGPHTMFTHLDPIDFHSTSAVISCHNEHVEVKKSYSID